jgi:hypothetical protein
MTDIRHIAGISEPYYKINREERFFCAILYGLLIQNNSNLKSFIRLLNQKLDTNISISNESYNNFEIYFEYAYLRDIWNNIGFDNDSNTKKHELIFNSLDIADKKLRTLNTLELNKTLVGLGKPSELHIQNPGIWSISMYANYFPGTDEGNSDFLKISMFKWCFNIKPDIVIQITPNKAISIEAKLESREGYYPSSDEHIKEFRKRNKNLIKQIDLQIFMFEKLLDTRVSLFNLVTKETKLKDERCKQITWKDVFLNLDLQSVHPFVLKALDRFISKSEI